MLNSVLQVLKFTTDSIEPPKFEIGFRAGLAVPPTILEGLCIIYQAVSKMRNIPRGLPLWSSKCIFQKLGFGIGIQYKNRYNGLQTNCSRISIHRLISIHSRVLSSYSMCMPIFIFEQNSRPNFHKNMFTTNDLQPTGILVGSIAILV